MSRRKEFECIDIFGYKVSCSRGRWKHICEHVEMGILKDLVISIINKPDFVNKSRLKANRFTFYRKVSMPNLAEVDTYIRVVIEYNMDKNQKWRGGVITAMNCDGPQLGEVTLWRGRAI